MPRVARIVPPGGFLHVIARGNNHRHLFLHERDYKAYQILAYRLKREEAIKIFHYCFMPTHVHFLVGLVPGSNLARFMKRLNLNYFYHYRKKHTYMGHLWHGRFRSIVIDEESYFIQCGKYIELNPVRAHIVDWPQDYVFSSYRHYALGVEDKLVDDSPLYMSLSHTTAARHLRYRHMVIDEGACRKFYQI